MNGVIANGKPIKQETLEDISNISKNDRKKEEKNEGKMDLVINEPHLAPSAWRPA